mmetsp:Transcript_34772/g.98576  ORF Transcript_34772/g.98576 Transcript_34772/m.98576 type:complete len:153 (-) Transcript_34772:264-722(-)
MTVVWHKLVDKCAACILFCAFDNYQAGKTAHDWAKESDTAEFIELLTLPAPKQQASSASRPQHSRQKQFYSWPWTNLKEEPPHMFICPITQDVMLEPVVAADGNTYDRQAIEKWYELHDTSPLTNQKVEGTLIPNRMLQSEIKDWMARNTTR